MRKIGTTTVDVIFSHTPPNTTGALVIPAEVQATVDQEMHRLLNRGLDHRFTAPHPDSGVPTVSFMPLPPGRIELVRRKGISHGERFRAVFHVLEKTYRGQPRREMWLMDAQRLTTHTVA